ncbi:hypothetical protein [Acinetobacter sp.]|uniref:hypothetical protein n=1 Tax=Acinetobacter sp. TaxID=472 RepID=UPI003CFC1766
MEDVLEHGTITEEKLEIADVSINNPEYVDEMVGKSVDLKQMINLKFMERAIKEQIAELAPKALKEYHKIFSGAKRVIGQKVNIQLSYGPTSYVYSNDVDDLKKKLSTMQRTEKKDGTASAIPSEEMVIKVTFKDTKNEEESDNEN